MTQDLSLIVDSVSLPCEGIREVILRAEEGALPQWDAGAHLRVNLNGLQNAYSLMPAPKGRYRLAVRLDPLGKGGSKAMHGLVAGDHLTALPPKNDFPLDTSQTPVVLLAGGIGVTPLLAMAHQLAQTPRPWSMHYAVRSATYAAFADELAALGPNVTLHFDDIAGGPLPVAKLIAQAPADAHIYACGPRPMLEAARTAFEATGRPADQFHLELFETAAPQQGDQPFEVEINSGQVFTIPPDKTILEVLEAGGIDLIYDCQRGDCGICQVQVIEGIPDHRDVVLSQSEKERGKVMQICVSRALSPRLRLNI